MRQTLRMLVPAAFAITSVEQRIGLQLAAQAQSREIVTFG
jgi:hypothetical protein